MPKEPLLRLLARRRVTIRESFGGTEFELEIRLLVNTERDTYVLTTKTLSDHADIISINHLPLEE